MAIQKKGKPAMSNVVGMNPDEFIEGGLPGDFDGRIIEARTAIWNYDNGNGPKIDEVSGEPVFTLAVKVTVQRDGEDEDDLVQYYSAGDPTSFAPSMDGENPSEPDEAGCSEGHYFVRVGTRAGLNNNSNYAQFLGALKDAGFDSSKFVPNVSEFLEGVYGHWDRIPPKRKSGIVADPSRKRSDILVITELKDDPGTGKATKTKVAAPAKAAPAKSGSANANTGVASDLDDQLRTVVLSNLPEDGSAMRKGTLAAKVTKSDIPQAMKAKGVTRITSNDFLQAGADEGLWDFDADEGTVAAAE